MSPDPAVRLRFLTFVLTAGLGTALIVSVGADPSELRPDVVPWVVLTALLAISEQADLSFHDEEGRWGLSAAEALFLPLLVGFSMEQAALGATIAIAIAQTGRWRLGMTKIVFNVAQYGLAATAASWLYHYLALNEQDFSVRNAASAVVAAVLFSSLTHIFVALGKASVGLGRFLALLRGVAPAAAGNIAGNVTLGLFFAGAYMANEWTVVLFPLALFALYLGYRGVLAQRGERDRVVALHEASRALASSPDLHQALDGFLKAVRSIASAAETRVVLRGRTGMLVFCRAEDQMTERELSEDATEMRLLRRFETDLTPLVVRDEETGQPAELVRDLGGRNLLAVPLVDHDELMGCLLVLNRIGAEEFTSNDAELLRALGHELLLTLDSYRLFEEVKEERERFSRIFEGSKEGIALLDQEGVIQAWNPALERITGYHEEDIIGEKWSERVLVRDIDHRRIEGMQIVEVAPDEELEVVTRQGPARWVSLLTGQVQTGEDKQWVIIVRDITAEHEIEEAKSDFLSTISHELRTPLTTIKGSLQMLGRPAAAPQSDVGRQMVDIMRRGADRLERLVMNLLTVSQMETGDLQVFPDEVTLRTLVESRIKTVLIDHPQVDLNSDDDVVVRADRERLGQVIEHLLDNARKFGGPEGRITIDITKENGYAHLTVADEGPGIPRNDHERVFDRFTRLGHLLTRETQGAGVGLFIAKTAVEAMAGEIFVESDGQHGSTFHVRIPLAQPVVVQEPATSA